MGLSTLAISVSEPTETAEDVYEPFLIREGLPAHPTGPGGHAAGRSTSVVGRLGVLTTLPPGLFG
ncbi:MAG: Holliday junction DNA helicase RuvB C-terminal domain-containing protein [Acidimicrobiales bacterium]